MFLGCLQSALHLSSSSLSLTLSACVQHPVYCVNVVGTQNANNLISISTDGKMCSWSLDMLSTPQVTHTQLIMHTQSLPKPCFTCLK